MEQRLSGAASRSVSLKYPTVHGIRRFIIVFTRTTHYTLFWARWIHSTYACSIS